MKIEELQKEKYYTVRDFLSILANYGLPHSIIWFEKKLIAGYIPREFILQEKKNTNRFIKGEHILILLDKIFKR